MAKLTIKLPNEKYPIEVGYAWNRWTVKQKGKEVTWKQFTFEGRSLVMHSEIKDKEVKNGRRTTDRKQAKH